MGRARCTLKVRGLDCPVEVAALRSALENAPGVGTLGFDLIHEMMTVDYDPEAIEPAALARRIATRAGMRAELAGAPEVSDGWWSRNGRWASTAASGLALLAGVLIDWLAEAPSGARVAYGLAVVAGGLDLAPRAARSLRHFRLDIHVLMGSAVLGAIALGQWDEAATVAFLFGLSESLEALSVDRARRAVRALLEVAPESAERIGPDGSIATVPASEIVKGDRVRVRSGGRVPVDGSVVSGRSSVDQKAITGESVPVLREVGDGVFAGSVNGEGALEVEASGTLDDSLISRVADRVREAQASRAPVERTVERFAAWYTPMVVVVSLLVMLVPPIIRIASGASPDWSTWFARGLVVLVIACPCALVIATPVALASALAAAARRGILLKGGQFLEEIGRLRVLAFDKTGTLTLGEPDVVEVVPTDGRLDADVLRIAAALSDQGGHVLGRAISRHARTLRLEVPVADGYEAVPGLGASGRVGSEQYHIGSHRYIDESGFCPPDFHARLGRAEGDIGTSVALTTASGPIGWIRLADRPRPEAAAVVAELNALGIETVMLTGDNHPTAAAMARELGIADQRSGLLPADKAVAIAELNDARGPTGMVGDGVNDAPALAAARVSFALGGISSASALETADVVLMADDLAALPWLVRLGRDTLSRIRQNIALALGSKLLVLILAIFGMATLWMAILADVGVSLLVTANAVSAAPADVRRPRIDDFLGRAGLLPAETFLSAGASSPPSMGGRNPLISPQQLLRRGHRHPPGFVEVDPEPADVASLPVREPVDRQGPVLVGSGLPPGAPVGRPSAVVVGPPEFHVVACPDVRQGDGSGVVGFGAKLVFQVGGPAHRDEPISTGGLDPRLLDQPGDARGSSPHQAGRRDPVNRGVHPSAERLAIGDGKVGEQSLANSLGWLTRGRERSRQQFEPVAAGRNPGRADRVERGQGLVPGDPPATTRVLQAIERGESRRLLGEPEETQVFFHLREVRPDHRQGQVRDRRPSWPAADRPAVGTRLPGPGR